MILILCDVLKEKSYEKFLTINHEKGLPQKKRSDFFCEITKGKRENNEVDDD